MRKALFLCLLTLGILPNYSQANSDQGSRANRRLLIESKRIIFLGDSITYNGGYVANFETWLKSLYPKREFDVINLGLPSETLSGLSEPNHAGGKFPRPCLMSRLDSVLEKAKPDLIFANYGMNCGIYQPFSDERFAKYQEGINQLKAKAHAAGAKIIFLTPPPFDNQRKVKMGYYSETLSEYSAWLLNQRTAGWNIIDVHSEMSLALKDQRKDNQSFTYQSDSIHPNKHGHWVISQSMLRWFGDPQAASSINIAELITLHKLPAGIYPLIKQRMIIKRDAWLSFTGHTRPGLNQGLPLVKAETQSAILTKDIKRLVKLAGQ